MKTFIILLLLIINPPNILAQERLSNIVRDSASASIKKITVCNSRTMPDDPLYVIDGVLLSYDDFTKIEPTDITSISILKNVDSTMFCNSSHKSVILIKTKKSLTERELRKHEREAKRLAKEQTEKS